MGKIDWDIERTYGLFYINQSCFNRRFDIFKKDHRSIKPLVIIAIKID